MRINDFAPYVNNAKIHTPEQIKKIANSIEKFGFLQPIIIDKNNVIVVGHGRYEASQLLGLSECREASHASKGEKFIPYLRISNLTEEEITAYRLADNRLNDSDWNEELYGIELQKINVELQDVLGLEMEEIETKEIENPKNKNKEINTSSLATDHECPKCGFQFSD